MWVLAGRRLKEVGPPSVAPKGGVVVTGVSSKKTPRIPVLPSSPLGWRAVWCAVIGTTLTFVWQIMPLGALPGFMVQLGAGVFALMAITREKDRAVAVILSVVPMLFVLWFLAAELLSLAGILPEH